MSTRFEEFKKGLGGELQAILNQETDVGAVLRAQLLMEEIITEFLRRSLVVPGFVDKRTFSFKMALLEALGLTVPRVAEPLQCLNRLRNRMAHELRYQVLERDVAILHDSLPERSKAGFSAAMEVAPSDSLGTRLRVAILAIFFDIDLFYGGEYGLRLDERTRRFRALLNDDELLAKSAMNIARKSAAP